MLKFVGAPAFLAFSAVGFVCKGGVTLFLAVVALGNTRIHRCAFHCSNVPSKVKRSIYESFCLGAILGIPDVDPNN